jgi:hypothetical protein
LAFALIHLIEITFSNYLLLGVNWTFVHYIQDDDVGENKKAYPHFKADEFVVLRMFYDLND